MRGPSIVRRSLPGWGPSSPGAVARTICAYVALTALALVLMLPFLWMVSTSLADQFEVYSYPPKLWPSQPHWDNYAKALTQLPFGRFFLNSLVMSLGTVGGQLLICSMAAYGFARLRFAGKGVVFGSYLATMLIPQIVLVIPLFLVVQAFGWMNTYWALIVPFVNSVWGIFLLRQFFLTLPRELEEAARLDGASEWTIFTRIILPLSKPALATLAIFAFISTWQSFLWPLIVTDSMSMRPVEVGVAMFSTLYTTNLPYQMAAAVTVTLPIIVVFLVAQRYFIRGIALSGVRG